MNNTTSEDLARDPRLHYLQLLLAQLADIDAGRVTAPLAPPDTDASLARLRALQADARDRFAALTRQYAAGDLTREQWHAAFARDLRALHLLAAALARGNFAALTRADLRTVERQIETQLRALDGWERALSDPTPRSDALAMARAQLYAGAASATFSHLQASAWGVDALLPFHPAEGTLCYANCGCHWRITRLDGDGNFDCFWVRGKDDSCAVCLAREAACAPFRIRDGVPQAFATEGTMA